MPANEDSEVEQSTRRSASPSCKPLLDAATPELFQANAFRITGLPVDATAREITKHADKLKMMEELGQGEAAHTAAFALNPPPTVDQIRNAIQKLKDPEQRVVDEFFWFWPERFGRGISDPSIRALADGDSNKALEIWGGKETDPTDGVVAMHNIALFWHLAALEWENYSKGTELSDEQRREVEQYWRNAFKRWEHLAVDDLFWERVSARIKQIDDPRLTTGFVRRMRATLPQALDKINAQLAVRYAESDKLELAQLHVQFMRETNQGFDNVEKTAEMVLAPARTRLKDQIERARQCAEKNPANAANAARELLGHARRSLALFDLFFGLDSDLRNELSDEIAALCNQLQVTYHKATGDDKTCLDTLNAALPFATAIELRQQIQKNLDTLTRNLTFQKLDPVYALLRTIQDSKDPPGSKLRWFKRDVLPALAEAASISGVSSSFGPLAAETEASAELANVAAIVLRGISIDAWNTSEDRATAVDANGLALQYASKPELRKQLSDDQVALQRMLASSQERAVGPQQAGNNSSSSSGGVGCLVVLGIVGVLAAFGSCNSNKQSSTNSSYSAPSTPTPSAYNPPATSGANAGNTYRVPRSMSSALSQERQSVELAKAQAESLSNQLESLSREIERDRLYLDRTSQFSVDALNRKVSQHNSLLEQARAQDRLVNQMVADYNAKLQRYAR